ncbi:Hypothetical_protein [Hexamita inflata]|uniref:Hypothetical_protein n=1 Tax=Hexamita inflata TaxID=28002 RepID=A0AA86URM7_9EUKA|nr:Hypothetical protein HINF_LOCUS53054 [Hexamita inflata]
MNPLPWREASTILSIIIKCTNIERIPLKKKSKVIQVFVFVLDLMKGTREELNIWSNAQIKKYQLKVIQWSYCRIQLQYDSIQYYQDKTRVGYKLKYIPHQVFEYFVDSSQNIIQVPDSIMTAMTSHCVQNIMIENNLHT